MPRRSEVMPRPAGRRPRRRTRAGRRATPTRPRRARLATTPTPNAMWRAEMNGAMSRPSAPTCVPEKIERRTDGSIALDDEPDRQRDADHEAGLGQHHPDARAHPALGGRDDAHHGARVGRDEQPGARADDRAATGPAASTACRPGSWSARPGPTAVTSIPSVARKRDPIRSASAPLIGDRTSSPSASGASISPAVTGS